MKLDALKPDAVRSTDRTSRLTSLSDRQLGSVAAGGPKVDPDLCAIHDYYFSDCVE